jgi:beta-N-acetylhexosaminidase
LRTPLQTAGTITVVDLSAKPFNLNQEDIRWVQSTIAGMTLEEKIAQLLCLIGFSNEAEFYRNVAQNIRPAGLMLRPKTAAQVVAFGRILQENAPIPMLISANLEKGGTGVAEEGTTMGSQMGVAATADFGMGAKLGTVCGREGAALGINWAYSPVIDIDFNFRNPITNTRTFGSNPATVRGFAVEFVKAIQKEGVAACIKHFPGDGVDERDQHLVTSINSLSCEEWDKSYGAVYQACIDAGAMSVMAGHILQPAYSRKFNPAIEDRDILPATLSPELVIGLLREQMGFNGLIVSDATTMAGMMVPMSRWAAVPQIIAAGCDLFLFTRNFEEDFGYMRAGLENGVISPQRLHDAVTRTLGLKAALGLHRKRDAGTLLADLDTAMEVLGNGEHRAWTEECADKSITLVKEEPNVLPLSPARYKKVLFYPVEAEKTLFNKGRAGVGESFRQRLLGEGFDVDVFAPELDYEGLMAPYEAIAEKYDLIVYLANLSTKSNQTVVRIEWQQPMGANVPTYMSVIPTIFISVENPYHLIDVPRVKTYINAYSSTDAVLDALIEKLMGRSAFSGKSPIDPFCGMWDTKLS